MKHKMLMPKDTNWEKYSEFWYNLKKGKVKSGEFKRKNKANELIWIYGNYNPIKNPYGEVYRVLKIASDITDKKKIEAEIAKKNGYLEHAAKILRHDMHSGINSFNLIKCSLIKHCVYICNKLRKYFFTTNFFGHAVEVGQYRIANPKL